MFQMIYITGDCHREYRRFNTQNFPEQKGMTKEDYVIVCGDFGGVWSFEKEDKEENICSTGWKKNHLRRCSWMGTTKILTGFMDIRLKTGMVEKCIKSDPRYCI